MKKKANLISEIYSIGMTITPEIDGCIALPVGFKKDKTYYWTDVVDLISEELSKEPGVTVENAMFHMTCFCLNVELQDKETPENAQKRVSEAFDKIWKRFTKDIKKGISLKYDTV